MSKHDTHPQCAFLGEGPPLHETAVTEEDSLSEDAQVMSTDDGRVDVDTRSRLFKTLSRQVPDWAPSAPSEPEQHRAGGIAKATTGCSLPGRLNIVIQLVGSRGDVQPFIALGQALQRDGHRVRVATHDVFGQSTREAGLEFYPIGGDPSELMAYMVQNPGLVPSLRSLRAGDIQRKRRMVAGMLDGCWRACLAPDPDTHRPFVAEAIIANPPSFAHIHCAEALGIPLHLMFTMPWTNTRAFAHPLANLKHVGAESAVANCVSYSVVEWMTWQGLGDVINDWRRKIDLEPVPETEGPWLAASQNIPFTYCWSPSLVPRPLDWPDHIDVSGFYFREPPTYHPPQALAAFLDVLGPPPVYIGFGSIVLDDAATMTERLIRATRAVGVRAVISRGWSGLGGAPYEDAKDIFFLGDCPHEWLFPRMSAVVHHGGAGTTACGLRYGKPTTVVPFFGDQLFWGEMIANVGAGPRPIVQKSLTAENLATALRFCLTEGARTAAQALAQKMQGEDGIECAVRSFYSHLLGLDIFCDAGTRRAAVWEYRHRGRTLKLSGVAAEVLVDNAKIDLASLKPYATKQITIGNRRWDPLTATASSLLGTFTDMGQSAANIVIRPIQLHRDAAEMKRRRILAGSSIRKPACSVDLRRHADTGVTAETRTESTRVLAVASSGLGPKADHPTRNLAAAMTMASAASAGGFLHHYTKGMLLDMPLAFAEGARVVPRLYGEAPADYGPVRDWKSGLQVSGKSLIHGVGGGCADLVLQPYRGARKDGVAGGITGMGKGLLGFSSKLASAATGVVAYPGLGLYKTIRRSVNGRTRKTVTTALREDAAWSYESKDFDTTEDMILQWFHRETQAT